jgi:enoyl-CoA hydratase/carnithine racemase
VVAKVTGVAAGAGCQLALACNLRVSGRRALIGMPIARLGILASPSFAARLSMLAAPGAARDLLYTGRLIGSAEAARLGLVTRLVPEAELDLATDTLVQAFISHPAAAVRAAKRSVAAGLEPAIKAARITTPGPAVDYGDFRTGVAALTASCGSTPASARPSPGTGPLNTKDTGREQGGTCRRQRRTEDPACRAGRALPCPRNCL